jgi:hypothetical protein
MKQALQTLVHEDSSFQGKIIAIADHLTEDMAAIGAMAIARERGLFPLTQTRAGV